MIGNLHPEVLVKMPIYIRNQKYFVIDYILADYRKTGNQTISFIQVVIASLPDLTTLKKYDGVKKKEFGNQTSHL